MIDEMFYTIPTDTTWTSFIPAGIPVTETWNWESPAYLQQTQINTLNCIGKHREHARLHSIITSITLQLYNKQTRFPW